MAFGFAATNPFTSTLLASSVSGVLFPENTKRDHAALTF